MNAARTPVIVGVGEVTQRGRVPADNLEPIALMQAALAAAQADAGAPLVAQIDSLDIVCEHSWPYEDAPALLAQRLRIGPAHRAYAQAGGESPLRLLHEAALRIARGEAAVAAVVGAEASRTVAAAAKAGVELPWTARDRNARLLRGADICHPVAVRHGVVAPSTVYPFYENACAAAWGQTPAQARDESARLWAHCSEVAARNPHAWQREPASAADIASPGPANRFIAWPYTLRMVANPMVDMGAAVILTSLERARGLGLAEDRLVHVIGGAAASEPRDFLARDGYTRSPAQEAVLEAALALVDGDVKAFTALELYSCFPVVPKMARRALGLPADAAISVTGGLSFFGGPLNGYMAHAAAAAVRALRDTPAGGTALLYGQGEYVTKHHALVLAARAGAADRLSQDYGVQASADVRRGSPPPLVTTHVGAAALETHTVVHDREGAPSFAAVIARTPGGARLMARVDVQDADRAASLDRLTDFTAGAVGAHGRVAVGADGLLHWNFAT